MLYKIQDYAFCLLYFKFHSLVLSVPATTAEGTLLTLSPLAGRGALAGGRTLNSTALGSPPLLGVSTTA